MDSRQNSPTYDPERWTRQWAVALGLPLLVLFFVPVWLPAGVFSSSGGWDWGWAVQGSPILAWTAVGEFLPPFLGATALVASAFRSSQSRRALLVCAGSIPVLYDAADLFRLRGPPWGNPCFPLALGLAAAATVASNHFRHRYPVSESARRWTLGLSAALLALAVFTAYRRQVWFGRYAIVRGTTVMVWVVPALLAGYASLSIFNSLRRGVGSLSQLLALMGRVAPLAGAVSVGISFRIGVEQSGVPLLGDLGPPLLTGGAIAAQSFCHEFGPIALTALGLCACLEPRVLAHHRPVDLATVAEQFG